MLINISNVVQSCPIWSPKTLKMLLNTNYNPQSPKKIRINLILSCYLNNIDKNQHMYWSKNLLNWKIILR